MAGYMSGGGRHHKGGRAGKKLGDGIVHPHKYGSHVPSIGGKDPHAHPSHHQMNQEHGTPMGFSTQDKGYQDQDPPSGIQDEADDECNNPGMEY